MFDIFFGQRNLRNVSFDLGELIFDPTQSVKYVRRLVFKQDSILIMCDRRLSKLCECAEGLV